MPSWSGAGNINPVSTTTIRPPYSTTIMFLPISPSPPSGRTLSAPSLKPSSTGRGAPRRRARPPARHRRPRRADVMAQHLHRGLDRDRVGGHEHGLVEIPQAVLDLLPVVRLVDDAAH